ncbi:peptidase S8 [Calothrix sp. 336/3]|nr:peptidase S8 [Calothrix sp. 336/3]
MLFKADTYDFVSESNENNNTFAFQITVNNKSSGNNGKYQTDIGYGLVNAAAAVAKGIGKNAFANINNLGGNNWGADLVKAPEVWAQGYTGKGITVAVIDTGVDTKHVDLSANIWKNTKEIAGNGIDDDGNGYIDDVNGWNFVNNNNNISDVQGHGTHVAGTIAAVKNNIGVTGIAYNAKIMPVKVLGDDGYGTYSGIAKGIRYAVNNGANVINLSLGGDSGNLELQQAIEYANSKGVFVVMASGNEGYSQPGYPAYYAKKWGIAVGSVNYNNDLSYFSNRAGVDPLAYVTAPGENIYSTTPGNSYGYKSGTSMATPHVAGVVALMLSANPNLTPAQVRSILTSTATA